MRFLILLFVASLAMAQDRQTHFTLGGPPPTITKAIIETRIEAFKAKRAALLADVSVLSGAIEDCQFWLDQLAAAEKKPEPTAKAEPTTEVEYVVAKREK